ncbi:hypothetical protein BGZ60DRAFT_393378 [Tricladium varicosporioides]|nr:hypothetical protein BGZ60DRAFT_393378 [Hymenoscyphus varicosporioides]
MSESASDTRTKTEVVVRFVATQIFALVNYGHTGSLLQLPKNVHLASIAIFFCYPTLIIGQLVYGITQAISYSWKQTQKAEDDPKPDLSFYLQGILGARALSNPDLERDHAANAKQLIPLFQASHLSLQRTTYRTSWKWFGRVFACLAVLTQSICSAVLFVRREDQNSCLGFDLLNGVAAIASAITGTMSLIILLMRVEWQVTRPMRMKAKNQPEMTAILSQLAIAFFGFGWVGNSFFYQLVFLVFQQNRFFEMAVVITVIYVFRKEFFKRIGVPQSWFQSVSLGSVAFMAGVDFLAVFITSILELVEIDNGGWKDPLSDRLLII